MDNELDPFYEGTLRVYGNFRQEWHGACNKGCGLSSNPLKTKRAIEMPVCAVHLKNRDKCDVWRV